QMPTCEAVGAIARGENLIVVGDPKQMPPTSFFGAVNMDEENEQEDLESILDDCLALSMPSEHLLWHYRSTHESLISFSNSIYYNNKLRTFPSTDDRISKVNFVKVDGFYDKGKTRQNSAEANAIVEEVSLRLSDPVLATQSIGIVTFSSVQQTLIEDKLSDLFMLRPDLEKVAYEREEPLFIKNLENVQGDERDVILFSIGYGPDEHGKVSLNFGPINRRGGGRRLNVAVSRARTEMKVFSTLTADIIDLGRTGSEGVKEMKAFLKYAASGHLGLTAEIAGILRSKDDFEKAVADALKARGYDVEYHVGASEFKIDIAVVDPSTPGTYLLAIVTDGENYKNGKTANDREVVQINMLKKLG
ncbi:MAG: DNA helicase, partial [Chitinophagaceae bacterium]